MFILGAEPVIVSTYADSFELNRSSFPEGFVFGTGSSNYQVRFVTLCVCYYACGNMHNHCFTFLLDYHKG